MVAITQSTPLSTGLVPPTRPIEPSRRLKQADGFSARNEITCARGDTRDPTTRGRRTEEAGET